MSGDIFVCRDQGEKDATGTRQAATMHRADVMTKNYKDQNANSAEAEKHPHRSCLPELSRRQETVGVIPVPSLPQASVRTLGGSKPCSLWFKGGLKGMRFWH